MGPVVMTALAAGLAVLPVVVMGSRPGLELIQPAAVALLGGLITSALVSLFVLPILYLRFGLSPAAEAAEPEDQPPEFGDLAGGAVVPGPGEVPGRAVTEMRAVPPPGDD
jgi:hypothetical protein